MFEKIAEKLYSKLEQEEVDGKIKYYKKREVFPPFTREGKIIWKNFLIGNWKSFLLILLIVLVTIGIIFEYIYNLKLGAECLARENLLKNLTSIVRGVA